MCILAILFKTFFKKVLQTDSRFLSKVGILAKKPANFVVHYYSFFNKWLLWYDAGRLECIFVHIIAIAYFCTYYIFMTLSIQ